MDILIASLVGSLLFVVVVTVVVAAIIEGGRVNAQENQQEQKPATQQSCPIWTQVTADEAKKHSLYGIRGWLTFFAFGLLIGFAEILVLVNAAAIQAGISLGTLLSVDMPAAIFFKWTLWINGLFVVAIYGLLFSKHPSFRPVSIYFLLGRWPAEALLVFVYPFPRSGNALASDFIPWAVSCAIWVTYLQRSKRVRVTFEHSVKVGQDNVAGSSQLGSASSLLSPPAPNPIPPVLIPDESSQKTTEAHEELLYAQIAQELDTNTVDKGLWTKMYVQAGGDDQQTRVLYIQARFARLVAR